MKLLMPLPAFMSAFAPNGCAHETTAGESPTVAIGQTRADRRVTGYFSGAFADPRYIVSQSSGKNDLIGSADKVWYPKGRYMRRISETVFFRPLDFPHDDPFENRPIY